MLPVGTEQQHDRLLAGRNVLAPIGTKRGPPNGDGRQEAILASPTSSEQDQAPHVAAGLSAVAAAGALLEQLDLARLGQRQAVDDLRDHLPRPETQRFEGAAEQLAVGHRLAERDGGRHHGASFSAVR